MNSKELKKFLEAQKLQTYYLLNKNETFIFFNGIAKFKMKYNEDNILFSTEPLYSAMKEDNLERYKAIPLVNRSKILNLKVISKSDEFNDFYISVMNDKTTDTFIIFYYMYRKYFTNFASYKEISTKDDLYGTILSLLKDNEDDPEAISEKVIFE